MGYGGGIALVREAGGFVTDLDGREDMIKTGGILAANEDIHRELLRTLKDAQDDVDDFAHAGVKPRGSD